MRQKSELLVFDVKRQLSLQNGVSRCYGPINQMEIFSPTHWNQRSRNEIQMVSLSPLAIGCDFIKIMVYNATVLPSSIEDNSIAVSSLCRSTANSKSGMVLSPSLIAWPNVR